MVEFSNPEELGNWLRDKPKEWTQVIALRTSLRVLPAISDLISSTKFEQQLKNSLTLSIGRALLISEVVVVGSTSDIGRALTGAADAARAAAFAADTARAAGAAYAAGSAGATYAAGAARAAYVADAAFAAGAVDAAGAAAFAADAAYAAGAARAYYVARDAGATDAAKLLEQGVPPNDLLCLPLWPEGFSNPISKKWSSLRKTLITLDPNWQFWIDWYQAILDGTTHPGLTKSQQDDLYYQIATFPSELWEEGTTAVNARIADLLEEIKGEVDEDNLSEVAPEPETPVELHGSQWDFFLSYATEDEEIARKVAAIIEEQGYSVLAQFKDMPTGSNFITEIKRGLGQSSRFTCLYSDNYWASDACREEWKAAKYHEPMDRFQKIIPFAIAHFKLPNHTSSLSFKNLVGLNREDFRNVIVEAISSMFPNMFDQIKDIPELEIEPQTPGALRFKTNDDGKIDIDPAQDHDQVLADEGAKNRHEEVLHFGEELISLHDPSQPGANAVTPLIEKMTRCLEAMGNAPEEVDIDRLIPRGEALRQFAQREENRDDFSFTQPIPDHFQETLNNFLSAYNIYVGLDPVLDTRDQARLGPDAQLNMISPEEGREIIDEAHAAGWITDNVAGILAEEAEAAPNFSDPDNRHSRRYSESVKNFGRVLLAKAEEIQRKFTKGATTLGQFAGTSGLTLLMMTREEYTKKKVKFIIKHKKWFIKNYGKTPRMRMAFKKFIQFLEDHPLLKDD